MGINILFSSSSYDSKPMGGPRLAGSDDHEIIRDLMKQQPNPNPSKYRIRAYRMQNGHLLVDINYPDCTNYEGNKVLLFKNATIKQLKRQKRIDPHFSKSKKFKSPFARFEPTQAGWEMGLKILKSMKRTNGSKNSRKNNKLRKK